MKLPSNPFRLSALLLGLLLGGCAGEVAVPLRQLPAYPVAEGVYDTSATCYVAPDARMKNLPDAVRRELQKAGYTVYTDDDFQKTVAVLPDFVIEVQNWRTFFEYHTSEASAYNAQAIVSVRRPGYVNPHTGLLQTPEPPRRFSAVAQKVLENEKKQDVGEMSAILDRVAQNLMRNPTFREALQAPPPSAEALRTTYAPPVPPPALTEVEAGDAGSADRFRGKWIAHFTTSATNSQTGIPTTLSQSQLYIFQPNGTVKQINTPSQQVFDLTYSAADNVLTFLFNGVPTAYTVHWRDADTFELRIADVAAYTNLLKKGGVRDATYRVDGQGNATSVLTMTNGVTLKLTETPRIYKRIK